jgi:hypothetical protein
VVSFPAFLKKTPGLTKAKYSDAVLHQQCFENSPDREDMFSAVVTSGPSGIQGEIVGLAAL